MTRNRKTKKDFNIQLLADMESLIKQKVADHENNVVLLTQLPLHIRQAIKLLFTAQHALIARTAVLYLSAKRSVRPDERIVAVGGECRYRVDAVKMISLVRRAINDDTLVSHEPWVGGRCCLEKGNWKNPQLQEAYLILIEAMHAGHAEAIFAIMMYKLLDEVASRPPLRVIENISQDDAIAKMCAFATGLDGDSRTNLMVWGITFEADPKIAKPEKHNSNDKHGNAADINCKANRYTIEVKRAYLTEDMVGETLGKARKSAWCDRVTFVVNKDRICETAEMQQKIDRLIKRYSDLIVSYETFVHYAARVVTGVPATYPGVINRITRNLLGNGTPATANDWDAIIAAAAFDIPLAA